MGKIEVVTGSMFSGKTEELIRRLKRAKIAKQKVVIFKPDIDNRYSSDHIVSHNVSKMPCFSISKDSPEKILELVEDADASVIGIDEAQFFSKGILNVVVKLAKKGKRVILAGCDLYSSGEPFGEMGNLMCFADEVSKLHAVCMVCGEEAYISYRKEQVQEGNILVGQSDIYEARCRRCANKKV